MSDVHVFRAETQPRPASRPGPVTRGSSWLQTHKLALGGGVAAAVALFALWRRHAAATAGGAGNDAASVAGTNGTTAAGLTAPDTSTSDIENWVQDQLNQMQSEVDQQLANSGAPSNPGTGTTAPKPGGANGYYKTNPGGAYYKIVNGKRWRISAGTLKTLQANKTVFHPITLTTANTYPLVGIV